MHEEEGKFAVVHTVYVHAKHNSMTCLRRYIKVSVERAIKGRGNGIFNTLGIS